MVKTMLSPEAMLVPLKHRESHYTRLLAENAAHGNIPADEVDQYRKQFSIVQELTHALETQPENTERILHLMQLLQDMEAKRTMIFVNMKRDADYVARLLQHNGVAAEAISGDVPQRKRLRMLRDFQAGDLPVLVATDVASRGLHVPDVSHVINYDLPQDAEDYVHRIGRTGRLGRPGTAITLVNSKGKKELHTLAEALENPITPVDLPVADQHDGVIDDLLSLPGTHEGLPRAEREAGAPGCTGFLGLAGGGEQEREEGEVHQKRRWSSRVS